MHAMDQWQNSPLQPPLHYQTPWVWTKVQINAPWHVLDLEARIRGGTAFLELEVASLLVDHHRAVGLSLCC